MTTSLEAATRLAKDALIDSLAGFGRIAVYSAPRSSRGKYLAALGNTPGHFQHWSRQGFVDFIGRHAAIAAVKTPLRWTLVQCRPRR